MGLDLSEYLDDFLQDARELLQNLDDSLMALEKDPKDERNIDVLFRVAHTLKGSSSLMGFHGMKEYTHALESVIELLRSGKITASEDAIDLLFGSFGFLRETIDFLEEEKREDSERIKQKTAELECLITNKLCGKNSSRSRAGGRRRVAKEKPGRKVLREKGTSRKKTVYGESSIRGDRVLDVQLTDTIRVNVKKLDMLLSNLAELVLNRTRTLEVLRKIRCEQMAGNQRIGLDLRECLNEQGRIIGQIQESIMKARMLPVAHLFDMCPRVVRSISRRLGKRVKLDVSGSATELDKKMIDALSKPFIHLLTNAVSHGIESPEVRCSLGKAPEGRIKINAFNRHGQVVITVEDDGCGIDLDSMAAKLRERDRCICIDVERLSPRELFDILATPGLSLADEVTDVSGRGVGLDAVKSAIETVNGSIEAQTLKGKGTKFTIKLPLTLAILPALLVSFKRTIFAVPLAHVSEIIRSDEVIYKDIPLGGAVAEIRGDVFPVVKLDQVMRFHDKERVDCPYYLISGSEGERIVIPVQELRGEKEIVVKTLSRMAGPSKYLSGASVLGNGEVALVLDVFSLLKHKNRSSPAFSACKT